MKLIQHQVKGVVHQMGSIQHMAQNADAAKDKGTQQEQKAPDTLKLPSADKLWDTSKATQYGGTTPILEMSINSTVGPLTYIGINPMNIEGKEIDVHVASLGDGTGVRLPIAASFQRAMAQANVRQGDKFLIKRYSDVQKKAGIGKGQDMQIYGIKVTEHAPVVGA